MRWVMGGSRKRLGAKHEVSANPQHNMATICKAKMPFRVVVVGVFEKYIKFVL